MTTVARDPQRVGSGRYSAIAILLHWLIAAAIVLQVVLANRMQGPRTPTSFAITQLHKSVGITILLLSLARLGWRLANPPPPMPTTLTRWERALARATHVGFYVVMIGMPLTGWLMVSASSYSLPTLLYGVVPWPDIPGLHGLPRATLHAWQAVGRNGHGLLAKLLYVLLALHVAGALKHQLFSRDEPVLARMAPGAVAGRWLEPRILLILLAFVGVVAAGKLLTRPSPGMKPPPSAVTPTSPAQGPADAQGPGEPPNRDVAAAPSVRAASTPAVAAPIPSVAAAAPAEPARWSVLPGSTLGFATNWSGQPLEGRFDKWRADVLFSPEALDRSKVTVTIDLASVNTGDAQRDASLPTADWFDAASHPQATFTARKFSRIGQDRYLAHGVLNLRGVARPVALPFTLQITGDKARVSGVTSLDRTAFGVGQGEWASTDQIPAKVTVKVELRAKRN